jgi:hypothetical protein
MAIKTKTTDLLRDPMRRAEELYKAQLDAVKEEYVQKKTSPVMNMARELGVNINELRRQARG